MKVQWNGLGLDFEVNWTMQHTNRVQSGVAQSVATALQDAAARMDASLRQMACGLEETLERRESVLECGEKALRRAALDANEALDSSVARLPACLCQDGCVPMRTPVSGSSK